MKASRIFTGSCETEEALELFISQIESSDEPCPISLFDNNAYILKVMTEGRNKKGDRYEGSNAPDDTGGFFDSKDGQLYLTDKAKKCITFSA